jgi:putative endonuclease
MTKVMNTFNLQGMTYFVYILASQRNGTLYVGVTNNLGRRIHEHREKIIEGFTSQYNVTKLVWFDQTSSIEEAIAHEKRLKRWQRAWKIALIEKTNPTWNDLYEGIL